MDDFDRMIRYKHRVLGERFLGILCVAAYRASGEHYDMDDFREIGNETLPVEPD